MQHRAHLCTLSVSPSVTSNEFIHLSTVFKAMKTLADRVVCFPRKTMVLFEKSRWSFVLEIRCIQVIPSFLVILC